MAQSPETIDYQSLLASYAQRLGDAEGTLLDSRAAGDVGGREECSRAQGAHFEGTQQQSSSSTGAAVDFF